MRYPCLQHGEERSLRSGFDHLFERNLPEPLLRYVVEKISDEESLQIMIENFNKSHLITEFPSGSFVVITHEEAANSKTRCSI